MTGSIVWCAVLVWSGSDILWLYGLRVVGVLAYDGVILWLCVPGIMWSSPL